jgi:diaminohydroxyphosphoribosylaminopyrimidine deaminase/5-amino-6-(5-phosphoribosylamino)uracil reductase
LTRRQRVITVRRLESYDPGSEMKTVSVLKEEDVRHLKHSLVRLIRSKYSRTNLPFVTLKYAQTLDGKIATTRGDSKWISGPSSLRLAHHLRSWHDAILVGIDTIIRDDPLLTVRLVKGKSPRKIVLDSRLRTPPIARIVKGRSARSTIFAVTSEADRRRIEKLRSTGAYVWTVGEDSSGCVDLHRLLAKLGRAGIRSILVEGGSKVIASFLRDRLADHLLVAVAPKIMGTGLPSVMAVALPKAPKSIKLSPFRCFSVSGDLIIQTLLNT